MRELMQSVKSFRELIQIWELLFVCIVPLLFFENLRDDDTAFNDFVEQAKAKTGLEHFELVRKRKRKLQADETREGEVDW